MASSLSPDVLRDIILLNAPTPPTSKRFLYDVSSYKIPTALERIRSWRPSDSSSVNALEVDRLRFRHLSSFAVCRSWRNVVRPLQFAYISLTDRSSWRSLAEALETMEGGTHMGSLVRGLQVISSDPSDEKQTLLLRMLATCDSLQTLAVSFGATSNRAPLTVISPFFDHLSSTFCAISSSLQFLLLSIKMDSSAAQHVLNELHHLQRLTTLVLFDDSSFNGDLNPQSSQPIHILHNLRNAVIATEHEGGFPYLEAMSLFSTPNFRSLALVAQNNPIGFSSFFHKHRASITDLALLNEGPCTTLGTSIPASDDCTLARVVLPYIGAPIEGAFSNVEYVGVLGHIAPETSPRKGRSQDIELLHVLMRSLKNTERFPRLRTVQLLGVKNEGIAKAMWQAHDVFRWVDWTESLANHNAEITDSNGNRLTTNFYIKHA